MRWLLVLFLCGPVMAISVTETKTQSTNCKSFVLTNNKGDKLTFQNQIWNELVRKENRLSEITSVVKKGSEINCRLTYPINEKDTLVDGQWNILRDWVWQSESPEGKVRRHQVGVKIVFDGKVQSRIDACTCKKEHYVQPKVRGVLYCWGPDGCEAMGIPFRKKTRVPARTKWQPITKPALPDRLPAPKIPRPIEEKGSVSIDEPKCARTCKIS